MKTKIIILMLVLFSILTNAQNNYKNNWKIVKDFENVGKPKSALTEVENIYKLAKNENNATQIIKSILFKSKYALTLKENAQLKIIHTIKEEIAISKAPEKNILESILANLYWQYFQQNRYKFYNRTNTSKKVSSGDSETNDFRTWDLHTIFNEIHLHYQNALQSALTLQNTKLDEFNAILNIQAGSKKYRPTVYDFIAHSALDFYKTGESNLAQPANKFEIEDVDFLADNETFLKTNFVSDDTTSQKLNALKIYKSLTAFHLKDKEKTALVDITLNRLEFVKKNARFVNKDIVYFETLKSLQKKYRAYKISTEIDYRIALYYQSLANTYLTTKNKEHQFKLRKAIEVCEIAKAKFQNTNGAKKCINLKESILRTNINLTNEAYIETNKESKLLVHYKNTTKLYFRIYKSSFQAQNTIEKTYNSKKKLRLIKNLQLVTAFDNKLKSESDFQIHSTEIIIPKLDQGIFTIIASQNPNFNDETTFAYSLIQVTDIALIESRQAQTYKYQVVNRKTGKPLVGARVHLENYKINKYSYKINKKLITDINGFISIIPNNNYDKIEFKIKHTSGTGTFRYYNMYPNNQNYNSNYKSKEIFLFTDRSIYRPSQTVYFKGIAVKQQNNQSTIIAAKNITVVLKDVNNQDVKTLKLKTNEFGSFNGEFILPNSGLTGNYQIQVQEENYYLNGNISFLVEEYKRPKFSAKFNSVKKTFKLNDSIKIKGIATAYAGSNITNAKVIYRVKRNVEYPKWWYWYKSHGFKSEAQEITHGETKTNTKGAFEINFLAQPDKSVHKKDLPVFTYEITADITDINGETRSATTIVRVGYHALAISIEIESHIDKSTKDNKVSLTTKNLNGEFIATQGVLKIYKVKGPSSVLRTRPWQAPDYQEIPQDKFEKLFPNDAYKQIKEVQKGKLVFEKIFDTDKSKEIELKKIKNLKSGKYIAIATAKDKFNQEVIAKNSFNIFSKDDKKEADNQLFTIALDKKEYKINETVKLRLGSASKDITIVVNVEKKQKVVSTKLIHLNNEIKTMTIPINKEDLGGFSINYHFVNYNTYLDGNIMVNVPYPKTELEIETLTFRDKLQPGQEETWSFKIKGNKKDKVIAEILTSMYDASLDQFKTHQWQFNPIFRKHYYQETRNSSRSFGTQNFRVYQEQPNYSVVKNQTYDQLNWFGLHFGYGNYYYGDGNLDEVVVTEGQSSKIKRKMLSSEPTMSSITGLDAQQENKSLSSTNSQDELKNKVDFATIKIRSNFKETAFFFPNLTTDAAGNISFSFTTPESLTKWKLQLLAHTKELNHAVKTLETVTQKELMVLPNPPRFLRQGDEIVFSSKITNLTDKTLNGVAELQLVDAITNKIIDIDLGNTHKTKPFVVNAKGNTNLSWKLNIPDNIQTVQYKIVAKAGDYSDGEQNVLPVLTNRMLVTETMPMWIKSNETKTFTLDKLKKTTSNTRKNHKLTLEVTSNPAWYAIQTLPYLMEYPYECAEQTFARYYANTLASYIANSNPRIQTVFNQWKNTDALLSNLEKNQELKSLIIEETPWLRDAQSETEQKKRIALLFDLHKMKKEQQRTLKKLKQMQMPSGGFPWFKGSRYANRYITQYIVSGLGHLTKLNVFPKGQKMRDEESLTKKAILYLDKQILKDYNNLLKDARKLYANDKSKEQKIKDYLNQNHTNHFQVHYLYTRSFYKDLKISNKIKKALTYYTNQSYKYWQDYNLYSKGLITLVAYRNSNNAVAENFLISLKENSITSEELGMYWKENTSSWYWYQAPIETQALMIEVFSELPKKKGISSTKDIDNLKIWLLKNKQTNRWKTTKATSEAVYALLLQGTDLLATTKFVAITIGDKTINPLALEDSRVEAGTGYYKTSWSGSEITPKMASVIIKKEDKGIAWGAMYWQYFEDLDKITFAETPLKLKKKLFLKTNEDRGEKITEITDKRKLQLGDLVRVRIELKVDRSMEFIHMKDMRASGFEPVNVLSEYKWQDGLGYYESTKDASTNFFIEYLPKGVYVFEYDLRVNNKGNFSNGITTIQSMYAPEFSSHSEGVRIHIE
ncbi:MAG: MG2 domain-containing protein [Flavobacteriaceae bacterium]|nr:MG2 domain-containing protein [Flavobacteriaceae bacterium]